jgi:hypothetical protein
LKPGEPPAGESLDRSQAGGDHSLPAGEAHFSAASAGGPERASSVRAALAAHHGKIFVLPSGRRITIDTLLDHLAEADRRSEWAEDPCEVCFAAKIEPWAAPSSAPCWEKMRGPLWHLWSPGAGGQPRKLIGVIVPDQRVADRGAEIEPLFAEDQLELREAPAGDQLELREELAEETDGVSDEAHDCRIELSSLIVEGEYHPRLAETDPAILALTPPAGEGWRPRWWKLGSRPLWQYGWWR